MEIDAELRRQIAVSLSAALVFLAGLVYIGTTYAEDSQLPAEGGIALVALLAGFVLLMAGVGAFLIHTGDDEDDE